MKIKTGIIKKLGFSAVAEKIYLALLDRGTCSIMELARLAGEYRPVIYKNLPSLIDAGLVAKTFKGKRIVYYALSPAALSPLVKKQADEMNELLPELISVYKNKDKKPKVSFFIGKEGIASAYERLISDAKKGDIIYRYESPSDYRKNKAYYPSLYWQRAGSRGDLDKIVITNNETLKQRHENINRLSKAVSHKFDYNITQLIGRDKVIFIDYDTEVAIMIENDRFANFQKIIFKMFFDKL